MDSQTLWVRRAIAVGVGLIILFVLIFGVKSCLGARKKQAFRNYVRDVGSLVQESNQQSTQLFNVLKVPTSGTPSPVDLTNNANGVRVQAEQLVDRANGTGHPSEMNAAQGYLIEVLEFRRDGITAVAKDLHNALGDAGRQQAVNQMAADMENLLTSDVIYSQRFIPEFQKQLKKESLLDETKVPTSGFLPDINWLQPTVVATRIGRIRGGSSSSSSSTAAVTGLHGTSLGGVTVKPGGQALSATQAVEIKTNPAPSLDVSVTNGGDTAETNVTVKVTISGAGKPIVVEQKVPTFPKGVTQAVNVPLSQTPPAGQPAKITIQVLAVPGEKKLDNNSAKYTAVFSA